MKKKRIFSFFFLIIHSGLFAQTILGQLSQLANQEIRLDGFNGFNTYPISYTVCDAQGGFKLTYSKTDYGVGYLMSSDKKAFFVILCGEEIQIKGLALNIPESIRTMKGKENQLFDQYAKEHPRREQALSAWQYLERLYTNDSLFKIQKTPQQAILKEKARIKEEDDVFLNKLPKESYVRWFLPTRKLVSNVSIVAQYRPEEIPSTIAAFRALDYTDIRLYKSGLFKDAIESHYWLLENSGKSLDSVFIEMKISIDYLVRNLVKDQNKLNEVSDYLFDLLERHSLFQASEYLAIKLLTQESCTLDNNLANQLETYRAMKKGNTAPEIALKDDLLTSSLNPTDKPSSLSKIKSKYTVVVFGASWCPKCSEELPQIAKLYSKWKAHQVEVLFISLDEDKNAFVNFTKDFPFLSYCDYKKWESPIAKNYFVFGTPTVFLLDNERKILLRPHSVQQMDAWVDWYLVQGNPMK